MNIALAEANAAQIAAGVQGTGFYLSPRSGAISGNASQSLTASQKQQARANIGAALGALVRPGFTRAFPAKLAAGGVSRVLIYGDSNVAGAGAGTSGSYLYAGAYARHFPSRVNPTLNHVSYQSYMGCQNVNGTVDFRSYDPRFSYTGGVSVWAVGSCASLGGDCLTCTGSQSGVITFNVGKPFDQIEIIYVTASGNSTVTVAAGGNTVTTIIGNQATALRTTGIVNVGSIQTSMTLTFSAANGTPIIGIITRLSTFSGIELLSAGWAGAPIASLISSANPWNALNAFAVLKPDLVIVNGATLNDASAGTTASAWATSANTLIDAIRATGSDIAWATGLNAEGDASDANSVALNKQLRNTCSERNVPLLEVQESWRPKAIYAPSWYYDNRHPNYDGYGDIAAKYSAFLDALSVVP